jgi:hypothetical protein
LIGRLGNAFFSEEKNQKTFANGCGSLAPTGSRLVERERSHNEIGTKVFCFFFSKKKRFLSLPDQGTSPLCA